MIYHRLLFLIVIIIFRIRSLKFVRRLSLEHVRKRIPAVIISDGIAVRYRFLGTVAAAGALVQFLQRLPLRPVLGIFLPRGFDYGLISGNSRIVPRGGEVVFPVAGSSHPIIAGA